MIARTIFEFAAIIAVLVGLFNEDKLIEWEDKVIAWLKEWKKSEKTS